MYGMVIAAVLTANPAEPAFGNRSTAQAPMAGCVGGYASGMSGCAGCQGCNGCQGGGILGIRDWFSNLFGGGCGGCSGCQGCTGGSCFGCSGCSGMPMMMGSGCSGSIVMSCYGSPIMSSGYGCIGVSHSYPLMSYPVTPVQPMQPSQPPMQMPPPSSVIGPMPRQEMETPAGNKATVVVTLPADARMSIDGQLSSLTGSTRVFETPPLATTAEHYYQIKIEVERGGKTLQHTETVIVKPGRVSRVNFAEPAATNTARIDVRIPEGATLTVEGRPWDATASRATVTTPALEPGKTYYYRLRAEWANGGRTEAINKEVAFRAGGSVAVDLRDAPTMRVAKFSENDAPE